MSRRTLLAGLVAVLTVLPAERALAQVGWMSQGTAETTASLEVFRPSFDGDGLGGLTSNVYLSLVHALRDAVRLRLELPIAYADFKDPFGQEESSFAFGNPYVGLLLGQPAEGVSVDLGIHLPLVDGEDEATDVGLLSDLDRAEAFVTDYAPVMVTGRYAVRNDNGLVGRLHAGPTLWIDTGDRDGDPEMWLLYGGELGYETDRAYVGGKLMGRWWASLEDTDFGDASFHQLGFTGSYRFGRVSPALHLRIPLDEGSQELYDFAVGVGMRIAAR